MAQDQCHRRRSTGAAGTAQRTSGCVVGWGASGEHRMPSALELLPVLTLLLLRARLTLRAAVWFQGVPVP